MARTNALAVPSVVAIRNGGLLSSANGAFDMIPNSRAGSETYSRKKFIQARPVSGRFLDLPQAKPMKISPKYGKARLRISFMGGTAFCSLLASNQALGRSSAARLIRRLPLVSATIMVYSTTYDKNADRQIPDRADRSPPDFFVPGRDLRYRSGIQQHRGMVALDSGGRPAAQGPAVLPSARREFRIRIRRLRLRAEPVARRFRRADPALAGRRDFRQGQIRQLSAAQSFTELIRRSPLLCSPDERSDIRGTPPRMSLCSCGLPAHKKKRSDWSALFSEPEGLLRRRIGGRSARRSVGFELLAGFFRALL